MQDWKLWWNSTRSSELRPRPSRQSPFILRVVTWTAGYPVLHHDNLNDALHSNLDKLIGGGTMTMNLLTVYKTQRQLIAMVMAIENELLNVRREKVYVAPNNACKRLYFPMSFIHGDKNQTYDLKSTDADYGFLRDINGPDRYRRKVF
ncbi:hypothetical protein V1524DRAFT_480004 [Lipomyces starkeyi]